MCKEGSPFPSKLDEGKIKSQMNPWFLVHGSKSQLHSWQSITGIRVASVNVLQY